MSNTRPPNRSPFHQNGSRSTPNGNNQQRSPQIKKHNTCPAWGSGAVLPNSKNNGTPPGQFGTPCSYNLTSPPPFTSPPQFNQFTSPPPQQHQPFRLARNFTSPHHPQHHFRHNMFPNNHGNQMFRTPQPIQRYPTSPQKSWSCDKNFRPGKRLNMNMMKSPRRNPNTNPGGSNDIEMYYHPSMLDDPWQKLTPVPVTHTPAVTT